MEYRDWSLERELDFFTGFDIGVMPLQDSLFTRGKCAFKLIQYMAAGVPVVASPVGSNQTVVEDGVNGLLAESPQEWEHALEILLADSGLRERMGEYGREIVREKFSLERYAEPYAGYHQEVRMIRVLSCFRGCIFAAALIVTSVFTALAGDFMFGVNADNWKGELGKPGFAQALKDLNVEFVVWHLSPEEEFSPRIMELVEFCRKHNLAYLFNTELVNYVPGVPYFQNADGTYRWDIRDTTLKKLKNDPLFLGQVYDEPMLMQSLNGQRIHDVDIKPYFLDTTGMAPDQAFDAVTEEIRERTDAMSKYGKLTVFEMVYPDYAAAPARAGAILAPKVLKETSADLMFAVYAGAARQYGAKEIWACVDLWFLDKFPEKGIYTAGFHTPDDLYAALCHTYSAGYDKAYVEHLKALMDLDTGTLTEYGKKVQAFQKARASLPRGAWKNFQPELVVKRFPSGDWGQQYSYFPANQPYGTGPATAGLTAAAKAWLALLAKESGGKLPATANNWNALKEQYFVQTPYLLEVGLPPMLVMDHLYEGKGEFKDARIIDLTK